MQIDVGGPMQIAEIYRTIQGEGSLAGTGMIIVRTQGCHVGCSWCDTKFSWDPAGGTAMPVEAIVQSVLVEKEARKLGWVLITGGEPAEQDLKRLVAALHEVGMKVALESSGTDIGHVGAGIDHVCISPKENMPGGRAIQKRAVDEADELKFVIGKSEDIARTKEFLRRFEVPATVEIFLQPLSQNEKATKICVEAASHYGWRLSLQQHKFINLP